MHPAERVDIVIDFSDYGPGEQLVLYNTDRVRRRHRRRSCASTSRAAG